MSNVMPWQLKKLEAEKLENPTLITRRQIADETGIGIGKIVLVSNNDSYHFPLHVKTGFHHMRFYRRDEVESWLEDNDLTTMVLSRTEVLQKSRDEKPCAGLDNKLARAFITKPRPWRGVFQSE